MMGNASSCGYHFFLSPLSYSAIFYFKCVTFGADLCAITVMICLNEKKIEEIVCGAKIQILAFLFIFKDLDPIYGWISLRLLFLAMIT